MLVMSLVGPVYQFHLSCLYYGFYKRINDDDDDDNDESTSKKTYRIRECIFRHANTQNTVNVYLKLFQRSSK